MGSHVRSRARFLFGRIFRQRLIAFANVRHRVFGDAMANIYADRVTGASMVMSSVFLSKKTK
ncbi:hypothetical protein [Lacisediminihabitans sp. H27-G8]|uniref:hypothetical protein n=1 Tax=Lacisediminihabitans sp. H27-G8 TaxID=3111909 RepID=UPI0038FBE480